ncbi:protein fem-1 homolog A-like [Daphnia pulex]|uniref:protein fem-1 homolog A-like n=1 Tax=Daphnia pulex TaxID=6669 RepID=UPI001EDD7BAB|nr:protein fem-1 homolog A-like [Daphnia pulex]
MDFNKMDDCTSPLTPEFYIFLLFGMSLPLIFFFLITKRSRNQSNACWRLLQHVFQGAIKSEFIPELQEILAIQGPEITLPATSLDEHETTAMLTAIQNGSCEVVVFLRELGVDVNLRGTFEWRGVKYDNVSPLCAAIISRQVDIVYEFVIVEEDQLDEVTADMDGIKNSSLDKEHKIEVLELMGAAYALCPVPFSYAISIWKEATRLRYSTVDGQPVIPKTISPPSDLFAKAMGFTSEFLTLEHLEQLEAQLDFDDDYPELNLYTQALLVIQRIMDKSNPEEHKYILALLCAYALNNFHNDRNRAVSIGMYLLSQFQGLEDLDEDFNSVLIETIGMLVTNFKNLYDMPIGSDRVELSFANLITTLESTLKVNQNTVDYLDDYDNFALLTLDLIGFLTDMLPVLSKQESRRLKQTLISFNHTDFRFHMVDHGNVLHLTCRQCYEDLIEPTRFPISVIKVLLELGADPNFTSSYFEETPLHILAKSNQWELWLETTNITEAVQLLLDSGANIDQPDGKGKTCLDLFKLKEKELSKKGTPSIFLQKLIQREQLRPLKCLAAQVIRRNRIPFVPGDLPNTLLTFVNRH